MCLCFSGLETKASVLRALRSVLRERAPSGSLRRTRTSTAERRRQQRCKRTASRPPDDGCGHDSVLGDTCSEPLLPSRTSASPAGWRSRLCSLTGELEAQLQRLHFGEEEAERGAASRGSSLRRSPGGDPPDLSSLLERDFSVQSMTSMINEDCFYEAMRGLQTHAVPGLQG